MKRDENSGFSIDTDFIEQYIQIAEVVILVLNRNANISYINRKGEQILGIEKSQLIGTNWIKNFIPEENQKEILEVFQKTVKGEIELLGFHENSIVTKSGDERLIRWHNTVLKDSNERIIGSLSSGEDVTEQRRIERELQEARDDWENIFQAIGDPVLVINADHKIIKANRSALHVLDKQLDEIIGQECFEFCHGLEYPADGCPLEKNDQSAHIQKQVMNIQTLDKTFLVSCTPVVNSNKISKFIHVLSDITELKKTVRELRESEERFRSLVEDINDVIFSLDLFGNIIYMSPVYKKVLSYKAEELIDTSFMQYVHPDDLLYVLARLKEPFEQIHEFYQYRLIDKDGSFVHVESSSRPIYRDGEAVGLTCVLRDITEKRKIQEQLLQTEKLSSLGGIISGVAHELNNPLTTIVGFSELLIKKDIPENVKDDLNTIYEEAIRSSRIVQSLLTFARKHVPEKKMTSINRIIEEAYKLREYELRVDDIRTEFALSDELPETSADPHQLQQVFINLINNAHHALLEKSGGTLKITTYREYDSISILFEDNGPGISDEHVKKIFDPFFTTKEVGMGTGLGLSVAFGIISEHDGTISVESEPGKRTAFVIKIPIVETLTDPEKVEIIELKKPEGGLFILIVEDEDLLRKFIATVLLSEGYYVQECENGEEAIEMLQKGSFDIIVSDMKMSGVSGQNLYAYVQKNHPDLVDRMLFITGDVLGRETQDFFKITGCKYLEKPFTASKLLSFLGELQVR